MQQPASWRCFIKRKDKEPWGQIVEATHFDDNEETKQKILLKGQEQRSYHLTCLLNKKKKTEKTDFWSLTFLTLINSRNEVSKDYYTSHSFPSFFSVPLYIYIYLTSLTYIITHIIPLSNYLVNCFHFKLSTRIFQVHFADSE